MAFQIKIYEKRTHLGTDLDIYIYCISSSVNKNRHKGSELSITTTLKRTRQMTPVAFGNTPSDRTFRRTQILKYCVLYCFQWEWEKILRAKDSASPRTNTLMTRLLSIRDLPEQCCWENIPLKNTDHELFSFNICYIPYPENKVKGYVHCQRH